MSQITLDPNKEYTVKLTGADLANLSAAIMELPAKFANPLTQKLEAQLKKEDVPQAVKQMKSNHKLK